MHQEDFNDVLVESNSFMVLLRGKGEELLEVLERIRWKSHEEVKQELKHGRPELFPMGSGLPDCSHACGPCFPCKRVIVGVKCFVSESCPVVYRCMCKGKYYPVPSN
ncbi:hypothetical protein AAC387_Pa01g0106 [Persea americana]